MPVPKASTKEQESLLPFVKYFIPITGNVSAV